MAFLKIIAGDNPGQIYKLGGSRMVIGRHPSCEIVLDSAAVSRHHAQVLENLGSYFLEDMRSRNRTYLNGSIVDRRMQLTDTDTIKICDVVFRFCLHSLPKQNQRLVSEETALDDSLDSSSVLPEGFQGLAIGAEAREDVPDSSSVITCISSQSSRRFRLRVNPEAKLRAVLEIGRTLASVLNLDEVLRRTLDGLFRIFPQTETGFVLLLDPENQKYVVKAARSRSEEGEASARISMAIVKKVMESGEAILSCDPSGDQRFDGSESLSDFHISSIMCAPLSDKNGNTLGVIQIDSEDIQHVFNEDDLDMHFSVVSQAGLAVENANLHEKLLEQREMQRDLDLAMQIQLDFLPTNRPQLDGYDFYDFYEAALRVGGDYFDYVKLSDNRIAVAVGDVAGKGISAALLMASLYSTARLHLLTQPTVADALHGLNGEIASGGLGHRFITLVMVVIDPQSHEVSIANAGHLPPLLRTGDEKVEAIALEESGMPLGVDPNQKFCEARITLKPGDTLLLYTDGVTEAMNPSRKIYGRERLSKYLSKANKSIDELVKGIMVDVEEFCEGSPQRDDVCLVCLRRHR